jgi:hypothetical protein
MTDRAGRWATVQVGRLGRTVLAYRQALLEAGTDLVGRVEALGLDETLFCRRAGAGWGPTGDLDRRSQSGPGPRGRRDPWPWRHPTDPPDRRRPADWQATVRSLPLREDAGYTNDLGLYAEEIGPHGEHLRNFPKPSPASPLISAA